MDELRCCGKCTDYYDVYGGGAEFYAQNDGHVISGLIACSKCECHKE